MYFYGPVVAEWHTQVLCLAARDGAIELGVSKECSPCTFGFDLRGFALRLKALVAHVAPAAGDVEGHNNAVALLEPVDLRAHFFHDPHGFVADDVALVHVGAEDFIEVQVRAPNGGRCYSDDDIRWFLDGGIGDINNAQRAPSLPRHCFHNRSPRLVGWRCPALQETFPAKQSWERRTRSPMASTGPDTGPTLSYERRIERTGQTTC